MSKRRVRPLPLFVRNVWGALHDVELRGFAGFVAVLLLVGTAFYMAVEGWSVLDAFYHSAMILTTIGSADIMPATPLGKLFTVAYVFVGLGSVLAFVAVFAGHIHRRNRRG